MILSLLTSRLAGPVATAVAVIAILFGVSQCSGRVGAEKALTKATQALTSARADLATCRSNTTGLIASIDAQNRAVDALKRESEAKVAEGRKAVSAARSVAASYRKEADRIMAARPKGDACEAADALVLEAVGS